MIAESKKTFVFSRFPITVLRFNHNLHNRLNVPPRSLLYVSKNRNKRLGHTKRLSRTFYWTRMSESGPFWESGKFVIFESF